jgi:DNA-binding NarL/FixJ family response regulator
LVLLWCKSPLCCYSKEAPIDGMTPNEIRTTLLTQKQRVAEAAQGWTVVSCSPDNELTAMAALLVPNCSLATGSIAELLAELPQELERLLVICDDAAPDGGAVELMRQLREARPQATCRFLVYLPKNTTQPRLEQLLAHGADALCCRSSGGSGAVLSALVQALSGMQSVDGAFRKRLQRSRRCTEQPALSSPELELIHLLARGHNGPQIAALRRKRCDSIRHQFSVIYRKTGVRNQRGLIAWALAHGVIRPLDLGAACGSTLTGSHAS